MEYLITAFLIFLAIDIYFRLRKANENILFLNFASSLVNKYEKKLLKEKVINEHDILITRENIDKQITGKSIERIKNIFVSLDPDYKTALTAIIGQAPIGDKEWTNTKDKLLKDILFYRQYGKLKMLMCDVEKKNIEQSNEEPTRWVEDKYGKDLFNEK